MKVRAAPDKLGTPIELDGLSSVVVYDDYNAPILVVKKMADGLAVAYRPSDPEFREILKALGIGLQAKYRTTRNETAKR